jgi:uncharacterized membrane protein YhhN
MDIILITALATVFLLGLLYFENKTGTLGILLTKPVVSALFVITAVTRNHLDVDYFMAICMGLVFCLIGDVCLIFMTVRKMFLAGLVSFLTGHLAYLAAFSCFADLSVLTWIFLVVFAVLGLGVYRWLAPNLGTMKVPVIAYIVIITVMVIGAVSLFGNRQVSDTGRYLVLTGALSFYLSDLFVARNQFVKNEYINRLFGLPLYFFAQFLIAFSVAYIG